MSVAQIAQLVTEEMFSQVVIEWMNKCIVEPKVKPGIL